MGDGISIINFPGKRLRGIVVYKNVSTGRNIYASKNTTKPIEIVTKEDLQIFRRLVLEDLKLLLVQQVAKPTESFYNYDLTITKEEVPNIRSTYGKK